MRLIGWAVLVMVGFAAPSSAMAASLDWPQYLHGPQHSSVSAATAFTTADASSVHELWHFTPATVSGKPAPKLDASPAVVGTRLYIGSEAGVFYALNASTGSVAWKRQLDVEAHFTCQPDGISSTAAVVTDPASSKLTVYVAGARFLYALNASTGAVVWKTMIGPVDPPNTDASYNWSSPTVVAGHIYIGLASRCDDPLIQGGVVELDQHTGNVLNTWHSVPNGSIGGSVWSSVAASSNGQNLWVSTGNECDPTINTCPSGDQGGRLQLNRPPLRQSHPARSVAGSWDAGKWPGLRFRLLPDPLWIRIHATERGRLQQERQVLRIRRQPTRQLPRVDGSTRRGRRVAEHVHRLDGLERPDRQPLRRRRTEPPSAVQRTAAQSAR